jgi:hypothetical protein
MVYTEECHIRKRKGNTYLLMTPFPQAPQSPDFKQLQPMGLLRYARNDSTGDFLRSLQN